MFHTVSLVRDQSLIAGSMVTACSILTNKTKYTLRVNALFKYFWSISHYFKAWISSLISLFKVRHNHAGQFSADCSRGKPEREHKSSTETSASLAACGLNKSLHFSLSQSHWSSSREPGTRHVIIYVTPQLHQSPRAHRVNAMLKLGSAGASRQCDVKTRIGARSDSR